MPGMLKELCYFCRVIQSGTLGRLQECLGLARGTILRYREMCCAIAVIQVLSRYWALWGIVEVAPEAIKTGALKLFSVGGVTLQLSLISLLFCWSATEILRYGFYAAKVSHPALRSALQASTECASTLCCKMGER